MGISMKPGRPALHAKLIRLAGLVEQLTVGLASGAITIPQDKRLALAQGFRRLERTIKHALAGLRRE